jgi:putative ABC transport system substrate-binding protein
MAQKDNGFTLSSMLYALSLVGALLLALCSMPLAPPFSAEAQQTTKTPRIGFLTGGSPTQISARTEALQQGLRELGYKEGKNIAIEWRFAEGNLDRLFALAAELVGLKVAAIITGGPQVTRVVKKATVTIPIIMTQDTDPVGNGFIASLARPGGNITGLSNLSPELSGKRLELLKEIVPKLSRVAVFGTSNNPGNKQALKEIEVAAGALELKFQYHDVLSPKDIEPAFQSARKERADAALMMIAGTVELSRKRIPDLAAKSRLPAMYNRLEYVLAGGLMTYGVSLTDLDRRAATYVDKILKGAKPAELPVEQPTKFEFIINLKAAKQIGLTIPPNVLARADRVVK